MKKALSHILVFISLTTVVLGASGLLHPHVALAVEAAPSNSSVASKVLTTITGFTGDLVAILVSPLAVLILGFSSIITYLAGVLLNNAIGLTVVNMSSNLSGAGLGDAINSTWGTVRDVANMLFIFVLLYTAIMTIFGSKNWRQTIVNLVIAAILINFSLFFTKVIIDFSNLLALMFYKAIAPGSSTSDVFGTGIANTFVKYMGLSHLITDPGSIGLSAKTMVTSALLGSGVLLIAAFSFVAIAIMFVVRYVVLILVLILSPLMFASFIIPKGTEGSNYTKKWWDALIGQAFFAPVYFFMTWISLKVIYGIQVAQGYDGLSYKPTWNFAGEAVKSGSATLMKPDPGLINTVLDYGIIIAFIIATILITKSIANRSGSAVSNMTKMAFGWAGGATMGVAGKVGRGTIGRFASKVADDEELKDKAAKGDVRARLQLAAARKTASSSFDLRGAGGLGKTLGAGKVQEGGYQKDLENRVKKEKDAAKSFNTSDTVSYRAEQDVKNEKEGTMSRGQTRALEKERGRDRERFRQRYDELQKKKSEYTARGASADEIAEIDKQIEHADKDFVSTNSNMETYLKTRVDRIKGVNEDEAKKRAAGDLGIDVKELNTKIKNGDASAIAAVDKHKRDSSQTTRKLNYARGLEEPRTLGRKFDFMDRIFGVGPTKKEAIASATAIRKDLKEKSKEQKLADAAKAITEEETTPPAGGGTPGTPPTGGTGGGTPPAPTP